jgi:hypothetical membrane protein
MTDTGRRLLTASIWAGVGAATITLFGVFFATLVSPDFWWTTHALSDLGSLASDSTTATPTTRLLFNGGLIAGGVVGLGFDPALLVARRNVVELLGVGAAGLTLVAMGLIGVFPLPRDLHTPVDDFDSLVPQLPAGSAERAAAALRTDVEALLDGGG